MHPARTLLAAFALVALTASAQTASPVVRVFHPAAPLLSYEVATIKPYIYSPPVPGVMWSSGDTARDLIRSAYSSSTSNLPTSQVVGGPSWIDKDLFQITTKPPADLELAMRNMTFADRFRQDHAMQQSLLADRFHLKVHFEVRELPIYALVPAKGGLKLKQVAAPPPHDFATPLPAPSADQPALETANVGTDVKGADFVHARAISIARFITILSTNLNQTGDRPVADQTGFTGYFDIDDLRWSPSESANAANASDAPSLTTALEETLGLRLVLTKGPFEVVVIDSIDRPTEN